MNNYPRLFICSESSVTITFGDTIDLETHYKVMDFNHLLLKYPFPGMVEVVPAYATVTVFFDPLLVKTNWPHQTSPA
ncbi:MAG TPA: carboxyltransferase domain-containing protein, partial [Saprospiraceae bacterium]|nr:carboxyltransferase domain-containing protein [Saprospiraceae bacterium]